MAYVGARLASLCSPAPSRFVARQMAHHGRDQLLKNTVQNTPIDDSPFPSRTPGTARASWHVKPVVGPISTLSEEVYETGAESSDDVATYLEYGTGLYGPEHRPYIIRPKLPEGMLRFYSRKTGQWVFAKEVLHPGIRAQRPLAFGVMVTEHEMKVEFEPLLKLWVLMMEIHARSEPPAVGV